MRLDNCSTFLKENRSVKTAHKNRTFSWNYQLFQKRGEGVLWISLICAYDDLCFSFSLYTDYHSFSNACGASDYYDPMCVCIRQVSSRKAILIENEICALNMDRTVTSKCYQFQRTCSNRWGINTKRRLRTTCTRQVKPIKISYLSVLTLYSWVFWEAFFWGKNHPQLSAFLVDMASNHRFNGTLGFWEPK